MTKRKIRLTAKPTEWIDAFADPSPPAPLQCTVQPTPHCNRQKTLPSYGSSNIRARPMGISPRMAQLSSVTRHCSIVPDANVAVNFPSPTDGRTNHTANETMPSSQPYLATGAKRPRRTTTKRKLVATGDKPKRRTKRSQATKAPLELGQSSCSQPSCLFTAMTFLVTYPPNTKEPTASLDTVHPLLPRPELEALLQELGGHVVGSGIQAVQRFLTGPTIATTSTELQGDASTALPAEANTVPLPSVVLVSPYPSRTLKYLLALAVGIPCVRTEWVLDAQRLGQVPDYRRYRLPSGHSAWTQQCIAVPPALQQLPSPCPMGTGASAMSGDQPTNPADLLPQPRARTTIQSTRTSLNALAQRYGITLPGFALFAGWVVYVEGSPEFRANWTDLLSVVGCAVPNQRQLSSRLRSLRSRKLSPGQEPLRCDVILINSPSEASSRGDGKGGKAAPIVSQLIANAHSYLYPCSAQTATPADTLPALVTLASPDEALIDMVQVKLGPPPIVTSEWFVQCLVHHQLFDWHSHALFTHHEKYSSQT
ncbi:hypothetical protein H4R34_002768 [Dimargaris verticillata]|uniref:BRCT domain-containing protein n=1 Tax=Dimargaris verticillata TaxID=2761393 RepID=A0A9W8B873_9FUNG|nr:hypothetical protein H4R34_002768 [Dimargaris verticillata]